MVFGSSDVLAFSLGFLMLVISRFGLELYSTLVKRPIFRCDHSGVRSRHPSGNAEPTFLDQNRIFPIFVFSVGHVDSARAAALRRRRGVVGAANLASFQSATGPSSSRVVRSSEFRENQPELTVGATSWPNKSQYTRRLETDCILEPNRGVNAIAAATSSQCVRAVNVGAGFLVRFWAN